MMVGKRNPGNKLECGSNYARSMACYALLNVFSGFEFDMVHKKLGFNPIQQGVKGSRFFWSLDAAWGEVSIDSKTVILTVYAGVLTLKTLHLPFVQGVTGVEGHEGVAWENGSLVFGDEVTSSIIVFSFFTYDLMN